MQQGNNLQNILRFIGRCVLYVFFFLYTVGSAFGNPDAYSYVFYVAIAIAIILFFQDRDSFRNLRRYYIWQAGFILFALITTVYTINTEHAFAQLLQIVKILVKVSTVAVICKTIKDFQQLIKGMAIVGGAVFVFLYSTGQLYDAWRLGNDLMGNANALGLILAVYSLSAIYSYFSASKKWVKVFYLALFIVGIYMVLLTGGRKFILFLVVYIYLVLFNKGTNLKSLIIATAIIAVVLYVGYYMIMNVEALYNAMGVRLEGLFSDEGAMGVDDQSTLMMTGLSMFSERPLFGWGIGGFQQYFLEHKGTYIYAHSNYIELLADFGLIGTIIYYSQYIHIVRLFVRYKTNDISRLFLPLIIAIAILDIFAISFNQTAFVPMLIMILSRYAEDVRPKNAIG